MKIHNVAQGSPEWLQLRLGIPTASEFHRILTPKKLEFAAGAKSYAHELVAEILLRYPIKDISGVRAVDRGKELEPEAARAYQFDTGNSVKKVGFITTDDGMAGASPDGLIVGHNGGVEFKCPDADKHVGYWMDGFEDDYRIQAQGQIFVAEFDFVDRYSFYPGLPPVRERTYRDDNVINLLRAALKRFNEMKAKMLEKAKASGFFGNPEIASDVAELDAFLKEGV